MNVYSYDRFSDAYRQSKGDSNKRQTGLAEVWCARHNVPLAELRVHSDKGIGAFYGLNASKGDLGRFLALCKAKTVNPGDILLLENIDRLSRLTPIDALDIFKDIVSAGVRIICLDTETEYSRQTLTEKPYLLYQLLGAMQRAHEESKRKSDMVKAAWKQRLTSTAPVGGSFPAWLRPNKDRTGFERIPDRVAIVKKIYQWALLGLGGQSICAKLEEEGHKAFGRSARWIPEYVRHILHSRTVLGEYQPGAGTRAGGKRTKVGNPRPGYYPAVISEEVYYRVQGKMHGRDKGKGKHGGGRKGKDCPNLFSKFIFDARDGCSMRLISKGNQGKRLVSTGALSRRKDSVYLSCSYKVLELVFLHFVTELPAEQLADTNDKDSRQAEIERQQGIIADNTERIQRIQSLLLTGDKNKMTFLAETGRTLEESKTAAEVRLERLLAEQAGQGKPLEEAKQLIGLMEQAEEQGKIGEFRERLRSVLRSFVDEVWVLIDNRRKRKQTTVTAQVFFTNGTWRLLRIDTDTIGTISSKEVENPSGLDLRKWRHED